jgi:hypothetical protein
MPGGGFAAKQNGPAGLNERNYLFDYGNAHFIVMDSNRMGNEGGNTKPG